MNFKELAIALGQSDGVLFTKTELEECVALVAAQEREECAKVAEDKNTYYSTDCGIDVATDIADAIRARSKA